MKHTIPTLLETQDHILFGLTAKQVMLLFVGLSCGYLVWEVFPDDGSFLSLGLMFGGALLPVLASLGVAFLQIGGLGLDEWLLTWVLYERIPKVYLWAFFPDDVPASYEEPAPLRQKEEE